MPRKTTPLPGDPDFIEFIGEAESNGHITATERYQREQLHALIVTANGVKAQRHPSLVNAELAVEFDPVRATSEQMVVPPPHDPMAVARMFVAERYTDADGTYLLRHHRGAFHVRRAVRADAPRERFAMTELRLDVPDSVLDEIAERVVVIVLAKLAEREPPSDFLSVEEAAEFLRCGYDEKGRVRRQRVYDMLSDGRLTRYKDGARVLISRAELSASLVTQPLPARSRPPSTNGSAR